MKWEYSVLNDLRSNRRMLREIDQSVSEQKQMRIFRLFYSF